jgi:hypothetical protein
MQDRAERAIFEPEHIVCGMGAARLWRTGATYKVIAPDYERVGLTTYDDAEAVLCFAARFADRVAGRNHDEG